MAFYLQATISTKYIYKCHVISCEFKKAAYLRRHMQNIHAYTITGLDQVVESSTQERHEDIFSRMSTNHAKMLAPIKRKINEDLHSIYKQQFLQNTYINAM
jgi:hypothetical protein